MSDEFFTLEEELESIQNDLYLLGLKIVKLAKKIKELNPKYNKKQGGLYRFDTNSLCHRSLSPEEKLKKLNTEMDLD